MIIKILQRMSTGDMLGCLMVPLRKACQPLRKTASNLGDNALAMPSDAIFWRCLVMAKGAHEAGLASNASPRRARTSLGLGAELTGARSRLGGTKPAWAGADRCVGPCAIQREFFVVFAGRAANASSAVDGCLWALTHLTQNHPFCT